MDPDKVEDILGVSRPVPSRLLSKRLKQSGMKPTLNFNFTLHSNIDVEGFDL